MIPWLKEKNLYEIVYRMVRAAEKWSQTHEIDKKQWVIDRLEEKGIVVDSYIDALIESCVEELDIATGIWFGKEDEDAD
ncbi:MAG: hypothetical protein II503_02050 [Clostridia bacterium]|nr:hypothetical protein [Clostridia bacterium]